jgi:hypothetical protein
MAANRSSLERTTASPLQQSIPINFCQMHSSRHSETAPKRRFYYRVITELSKDKPQGELHEARRSECGGVGAKLRGAVS